MRMPTDSPKRKRTSSDEKSKKPKTDSQSQSQSQQAPQPLSQLQPQTQQPPLVAPLARGKTNSQSLSKSQELMSPQIYQYFWGQFKEKCEKLLDETEKEYKNTSYVHVLNAIATMKIVFELNGSSFLTQALLVLGWSKTMPSDDGLLRYATKTAAKFGEIYKAYCGDQFDAILAYEKHQKQQNTLQAGSQTTEIDENTKRQIIEEERKKWRELEDNYKTATSKLSEKEKKLSEVQETLSEVQETLSKEQKEAEQLRTDKLKIEGQNTILQATIGLKDKEVEHLEKARREDQEEKVRLRNENEKLRTKIFIIESAKPSPVSSPLLKTGGVMPRQQYPQTVLNMGGNGSQLNLQALRKKDNDEKLRQESKAEDLFGKSKVPTLLKLANAYSDSKIDTERKKILDALCEDLRVMIEATPDGERPQFVADIAELFGENAEYFPTNRGVLRYLTNNFNVHATFKNN